MIKVGQVYQGKAFKWTIVEVKDEFNVFMSSSVSVECSPFMSRDGKIPGMTLISEPPAEPKQPLECKYSVGDTVISKMGAICTIKSIDEKSQTFLVSYPNNLHVLYYFGEIDECFSHRPAPVESEEDISIDVLENKARQLGHSDRFRDVYKVFIESTKDSADSFDELHDSITPGKIQPLEYVHFGVDIVDHGEYSHLLTEYYVVLPGKGPKLIKF